MNVLSSLQKAGVFKSTLLGSFNVIPRNSLLTSGFSYEVDVENIATNASLLILNKSLFFALEECGAQQLSLLLPLRLVYPLTNINGPMPKSIDSMKVIRSMNSQLSEKFPVGVCFRNLNEHQDPELCLFQSFEKAQDLSFIDTSINRLLDIGLFLFDGMQTHKAPTALGLAQSVESHRF